MLQVKNVNPNLLTGKPLILDENDMGKFSFEIEGNEDANSVSLVITDSSFTSIKAEISPNTTEWDGKINGENKEDSNLTKKPDKYNGMASLPNNLKLNFNCEIICSLDKSLDYYCGTYELEYILTLPYAVYYTKNISSSGSRYRSVYSKKSFEEKFFNFNHKIPISLVKNETEEFIIKCLNDTSIGIEILNDNSFKLMLTEEVDLSNDLRASSTGAVDFIAQRVPIKDELFLTYESENKEDLKLLDQNEFFSKIMIKENLLEYPKIIRSSSEEIDTSEGNTGLLFYFLEPKFETKSLKIKRQYLWEKKINEPYKTFYGKNNVFSFDVEMTDYLKDIDSFYIDLKVDKEIKLIPQEESGIFLGKALPEGKKEGEFVSFEGFSAYVLDVKPKEKYSITTIGGNLFPQVPVVNFYNTDVPTNLGYQRSIYLSSRFEIETIEIEIPEGISLITINYEVGASEDNVLKVVKKNQSSPLIKYRFLEKPRLFQDKEEKFLTISEKFENYELTFSLDESNKYPMLWYRVKIYNIVNESQKIIVFDTDKVFTSVEKIIVSPILLLPDEKYVFEVQICDTQNTISEIYSAELITFESEKEANFSKQEIDKYLSESFVKIELDKFSILKKGLYPNASLYPAFSLFPEKDISIESKYNTIQLLRENLITKKAIWINKKEWEEENSRFTIYDYGVKANVPYNYWAYVRYEENSGGLSYYQFKGIKLNNEPIIAEWDRWTLITADKDPEDEKVYHVDKVFTFEMNLSSGSMTNGTNITTSKNFTEFPIIQKDKSNFYSGSLTALMGVRKWGSTAEDFEQTPHMLEELRQLSTNYQPKFLKDRSGHLWQVEINGAIQVDNTDNLATIDLKTMTVPWVQIGEADDISLIYTGTEKKEDLYC